MRGRRSRLAAVALAAALLATVLGAGTGSAGAAPTAAAATKDPVVVVNGLFGVGIAYEPFVARLRADGYQVYDYELPTLGTQDIRVTARQLAAFVAGVRAQTGAAEVDLIGHSEGGLVSRAFVKYEGGAAVVDTLTTLGTPNNGTAAANLIRFFTLGSCVGITACEQMTIGSSFLADLNAGDDSIGSVRYTNIATVVDELVQPYTTSFLNAADGNITNRTLQSECWARFPGHLALILDGAVYSGVQDVLADRPIDFNCFAV